MKTSTEERIVAIETGGVTLEGSLAIPELARGVVLFAHGSGSSRHSPRNLHVAEALHAGGLGTLLIDLLTQTEEAVDLRTRELRFDIDLLADRLVGATWWLAGEDDTRIARGTVWCEHRCGCCARRGGWQGGSCGRRGVARRSARSGRRRAA